MMVMVVWGMTVQEERLVAWSAQGDAGESTSSRPENDHLRHERKGNDFPVQGKTTDDTGTYTIVLDEHVEHSRGYRWDHILLLKVAWRVGMILAMEAP